MSAWLLILKYGPVWLKTAPAGPAGPAGPAEKGLVPGGPAVAGWLAVLALRPLRPVSSQFPPCPHTVGTFELVCPFSPFACLGVDFFKVIK